MNGKNAIPVIIVTSLALSVGAIPTLTGNQHMIAKIHNRGCESRTKLPQAISHLQQSDEHS
jgi:hypothetical protein